MNKKLEYPKELELLTQEILCILDSEQHMKYYKEAEQQEEHEIEEKLTLHGLDRIKIRLIENLPKLLVFAEDLINFLKCKYGRFPIGYDYYKDVTKKIREYVEKLKFYIQNDFEAEIKRKKKKI